MSKPRKYKYKTQKPLSGTSSNNGQKKSNFNITKASAKDAFIETGKTLLIGVVGGGTLAALIGKPAFYLGTAITGVGHVTKKNSLSVLGMGMMTASVFVPSANVKGSKNGFSKEEIEDRLKQFKSSLMAKTYLDKIGNDKEGSKALSGTESFSKNQNELNIAALDTLESQVIQSGIAYQKQMSGVPDFETAIQAANEINGGIDYDAAPQNKAIEIGKISEADELLLIEQNF